MFFNITTPKFAAQAIKKAAEIGWKPVHFLNNVSASVGAVMKPAGFENAQGIITSQLPQGPDRPAVGRRRGLKDWNAFMDKYCPAANLADAFNVYGYAVAQGLVHVLKQCGDDLTRENVMKQAASLKDFDAADAAARHQGQHLGRPTSLRSARVQLTRFKGETWELFGEVMTAE